ncbi:MAG TPA: hypothetical protein VF221_01550 [Chloroflexota bacterium]
MQRQARAYPFTLSQQSGNSRVTASSYAGIRPNYAFACRAAESLPLRRPALSSTGPAMPFLLAVAAIVILLLLWIDDVSRRIPDDDWEG